MPTFEQTISRENTNYFILFIVILQYIVREHNNNRGNVYCNTLQPRRVIIRLIIYEPLIHYTLYNIIYESFALFCPRRDSSVTNTGAYTSESTVRLFGLRIQQCGRTCDSRNSFRSGREDRGKQHNKKAQNLMRICHIA